MPQSREQQTRERSTLRTIMDLLGRPGAAMAGFVRGGRLSKSPDKLSRIIDGLKRAGSNLGGTEHDRFVDVLNDSGMPPGMGRSALGLGLDVVVDPLNLVPVGPVAKAIKYGGKAVRKGLGKIDVIDNALNATTDALGKTFVPYYGLDETYKPLRQKFDVESRQIPRQISEDVFKEFKGTTKAQREAVATALDTGVPIADPKLLPLQASLKDKFYHLFNKESAVGLQDWNSQIADYFPYVFRDKYGHKIAGSGGVQGKVGARMPFGKHRENLSLHEASLKGADTDAATAALTRLTTGELATRNAQFLRDTFKQFGQDVSGGGMKGYRAPSRGTLADKPFWEDSIMLPGGQSVQLKNLALPDSIADDITRMFGNKEPNPIMKALDNFTSKWRGLATIYRPDMAFEMTNLQGNMWNAALGGQKGSVFKHVGKFWNPTPSAVPGMSADEVGEAVKRLGISNAQNMGVGEIMRPEGMAKQLDRALETRGEWAKRLFVPTGWHNAYKPITGAIKAPLELFAQGKRNLNTRIEGASKLSFFEDALRKTDPSLPADARTWDAYKDTSKHLFDYGELTDTEQTLRKLVPFYCVPDHTTALTRSGWKSCDNITIGEDLLTYSVHTGGLEWQPAEEIAVFEYDDALMQLSNSRHNIQFTPNHRWVTRDYIGRIGIKEGADLNTGDALVVAATGTNNTDSLLTPDDARLLGWLLTDGYWRFRGNHCEALIYQSPKKFLNEVIEVAGGEPRKPHPDTGVIAVPVLKERVERIAKYLQRSKREDNWIDVVTQLNQPALEAMYDAMYKADGTMAEGRTQDSFACMLPGVGSTFEVLATLLGKRVVQGTKGYTISKRQVLKVAACAPELIHYTGRVWCPRTVNGTWVMKQGNLITITGNTFMRKNLPLQVEGLANRPQMTAGLEKTFNALENRAEERGELEPTGFRPKWMQEGPVAQIPGIFGGMKIPGTDIKLSPDPVPGSSQFYNAYLPIQDLNKIPIPGGSDTWDVARELASSIHPVVKTFLEGASGQSMFTGLPLWDKQLGPVDDLRRAPFPLNKMPTDVVDMLPWLKSATVENYQKHPEVQTSAGLNMLVNNLLPISSTAGRTLDTLTGTGLPSQAFSPWTSVFGVRIMPRTPDQMHQGRQDALSVLKAQRTKRHKQQDIGGNTLADKLRAMFGGNN